MSNIDLMSDSTSAYIAHYTGEPALFCRVMEALQQADHDLCILHGYKQYPQEICGASDIDAISVAPDQVPHIVAESGVAKVVQVLQHEATAFSYTLYRDDGGKPSLILLDVSVDYRRNGRVFFSGEMFLRSCKPFKFFQVPATELEFSYYIIKKIAKADLGDDHAQRLSELYGEAPEQCSNQLAQFFSEAAVETIAKSALSENWHPVQTQIQSLRQGLLGKVGKQNPVKVMGYWLGDLKRRIKRILQPTGVMIVVLGADGSGKSTVIAQIREQLMPAFRRTSYTHLRPHLGRKTTGNDAPVINPHGQPPRSWLASVLKLIYFLFDYGVGYWYKVYPQLVRSTFVVFDRYYHDLLVDSRRYRYSGPTWWAKFIGKLIPKPDLWILLDAPAEVLQARKQEVSFEETARQREVYVDLVSCFENGVVINSDQSIEDVVADANRAILDFMAKRTHSRLKL